ncbi:NAD(P)-binding domain-containing protein, partial [Shewanella sp. 0m-11]
MNNQNQLYDIGVIGLGVMGKNLALNIADNQYRVAVFDLDNIKVQDTVKQEELERKQYLKQITEPRIEACNNLSEMLSKLDKPRVLVLSVPAGAPVDGVCQSLIEAGIEADDIVIDTGNSLWTDTVEREQRYANDFQFFSCAVSGGEVGARFGPSLMPSGSLTAWKRIEPIWQAIAAKVDAKTGLP